MSILFNHIDKKIPVFIGGHYKEKCMKCSAGKGFIANGLRLV